MNIFNLFITYGDTFLPNPNSYDELYYEIIRMHQVFDNLYSMGELLAAVYTRAFKKFCNSTIKKNRNVTNYTLFFNVIPTEFNAFATFFWISEC